MMRYVSGWISRKWPTKPQLKLMGPDKHTQAERRVIGVDQVETRVLTQAAMQTARCVMVIGAGENVPPLSEYSSS